MPPAAYIPTQKTNKAAFRSQKRMHGENATRPIKLHDTKRGAKIRASLCIIMPVYPLHQVFLYEPAQVKIAVAHLDSGEILAIVVVNIDRDIV